MATGSDAPKRNNTLHVWGNERTMNINHLILTNIVTSNYFKNDLLKLKTFHEIVDEIYNQVSHLEPWEKGSRKLAGQTGMCGGVRGVGAGGIVSSAFTLLYKLFTLRLTRKQLNNLLNHPDSPFIRGLGFMYIRYCQEPSELWEWFEGYLEDEEEIDVKAGGGRLLTIGEMCQMMLSKLDWFGTLFPRIPIPIQKDIESKLREFNTSQSCKRERTDEIDWGEAGRLSKLRTERFHSDDEDDESRGKHSTKHPSRSPSPSPSRSRSPRDHRYERSLDAPHRRHLSSTPEESNSRSRHKSHKHGKVRIRRSSSSPSRNAEDRHRSRHKKRRHSSEREYRARDRVHAKHRKESKKRRSKYSEEDSPLS